MDDSDVVDPVSTSLVGFSRTLKLEQPELDVVFIDLPALIPTTELLVTTATIGLLHSEHTYVSLRMPKTGNVVQYLPYLSYMPEMEPHGADVKEDGTYIITGGIGSVGQYICKWLVAKKAPHLAILSRKGPTKESMHFVSLLRDTNPQLVVEQLQCDVSNANQVNAAIRAIRASMLPIKGIFHAAGVLHDGMISKISWDTYQSVLLPKAQGAWNLHISTLDIQLDLFVLFSSVISLLGNVGQSSYGAANGYLDGLAFFRKGLGLSALSINWGPGEGTVEWLTQANQLS